MNPYVLAFSPTVRTKKTHHPVGEGAGIRGTFTAKKGYTNFHQTSFKLPYRKNIARFSSKWT